VSPATENQVTRSVVDGVPEPVIRKLGLEALPGVWASMQKFTAERTAETPDEIWFVEHPSVFTLGLRADRAHLLAPGDIPVVQIDRGGQVTYHGPGQMVAYVLLDLGRLGLNVRALVQALENAVIDTVADYGVRAVARRDAPGVYVEGEKLAAVGLRVRRNGSYHGLAVNVAMDLSPYARINPCGYANLRPTQLADLCGVADLAQVQRDFTPRLLERLGLKPR
jgi:lipoyl(octanoyl) transferase